MFASIKINPKFVAKLGCAVTIIVSISACSSESIQSDGALIPPALNMPTPEPGAPLERAKQELKSYVKNDLRKHGKSLRSAHYKSKKKATVVTSAARVSKAVVNGPSDPSLQAQIAIPAPDADQTAVEVLSAAPTDQSKGFLVFWLAGVIFATGGLLWFALRRSTFGRRKPRRLIFN